MTTKMRRDATAAVLAWCKKKKIKLIAKPRHVHPRAYVVGSAAESCLVVAECWADSEPQLKGMNKTHPLRLINTFDTALKAGDWCITAYICYAGCQEPIAIPLTEKVGA